MFTLALLCLLLPRPAHHVRKPVAVRPRPTPLRAVVTVCAGGNPCYSYTVGPNPPGVHP